MPTTAIFFEDSFDSAHWLPHVPTDHKCHKMHGHTYRIRLDVQGDVDTETGWIMDYADLRALWTPVKALLDHQCLNDIIPNPTCELIAQWIAEKLDEKRTVRPVVTRIELRETLNCGVVWIW